MGTRCDVTYQHKFEESPLIHSRELHVPVTNVISTFLPVIGFILGAGGSMNPMKTTHDTHLDPQQERNLLAIQRNVGLPDDGSGRNYGLLY